MNQWDDELAQVTDALMDGREMGIVSDENQALAGVVRELYDVIAPHNPPSEVFQRRLTTMLNTEWEREHAPTLRLLDHPALRLVGMAAGVVLILGALLVLTLPESSESLLGVAVGADRVAVVVVLVGVVGAAFAYWRSRR